MTKNKSSPYRITYTKLFWVFFICCFLGVVIEGLYFLFAHHHLELRAGVLYGPFNPVYGFGAVLMTVSLNWLRNKNFALIFVAGTVIGGIFEYLCSILEELFFGTISWDYSDTFCNIGGRTSLLHAAIWGLLGLVWIKWLYKFLCDNIIRFPRKPLNIITIVLSIFITFNMLLSVMACERQSRRREGIPANNKTDQLLDKYYPDEYLDGIFLSTREVK